MLAASFAVGELQNFALKLMQHRGYGNFKIGVLLSTVNGLIFNCVNRRVKSAAVPIVNIISMWLLRRRY